MTEAIDTTTPAGRMMMQIVGAFAEFEKAILRERTLNGLAAATTKRRLLDQSLHLVAPKKQFNGWSTQNHADSYLFMQRIAQAWKSSNFTNQYLIYGKIDSNPFNWEMVPYQKCRTCVGRVVQQLQVLWRTVFGGIAVSEEGCKNQVKRYEVLLNKSP